jgi:phage host-nuclease inhibitor protein Gam
MDIEDLREETRAGFASMREELAITRRDVANLQTDVGELRTEVGELRTEMRTEISAVRSEATAMENRLRDLIVEESKTTRRHFDVVAEDLRESIRIIGEGYGVQTVRLEDHERRLRHLEQR